MLEEEEKVLTKDFLIDKLTQLLIETNFKEKKLNKVIYVKKSQCYADLIKFIKEFL